ncbi:Nif3-like dinuclear metal center hexameric protein [Spirochaeta thermophila]|uniref:GTP cyclohydrolase 1 type 2 homolog n=1 Tax=Winmispira thermophila (strain ATCC 49972 / DSM 6192 / RI 19.B1) TaxID=665571 RepID=E0RR96_WINT6|nr:Nif3-like dinuclear metal center hexameric protein [Spirochaeta thermophila]ADN03073.1 hypothetical protein STHERM_c21440 [Spirochaeta thermophila DSM 6192]
MAHTVGEVSKYLEELLEIGKYSSFDASLNGLQVGDAARPVSRIAYAVDACQEAARRAHEAGADLLVVHHGLFWGDPVPLVGPRYRMLSLLVESSLSLFAAHLPLDAHPEVGNNARLAALLGLSETRPFGWYRGVPLGVWGTLEHPVSVHDLLGRFPGVNEAVTLLPFGPEEIRTVGVVSGSASSVVEEAVSLGLDAFITGEVHHSAYYPAQEGGVTVAGIGHYRSETVGPLALKERVERDLGIEGFFIDLPTGL